MLNLKNSDFPNEKLKFFNKAKIFPTRGAKISPESKNFQGEPISKRGSKILGRGGRNSPGRGSKFRQGPRGRIYTGEQQLRKEEVKSWFLTGLKSRNKRVEILPRGGSKSFPRGGGQKPSRGGWNFPRGGVKYVPPTHSPGNFPSREYRGEASDHG